ncbi:hypothetical protein DFP72DRAFT_260760 [Ephemerocybe angulata]|uniref:ATP-citrate synthase citrate-binding domain-containing protein n=1 Tax=Ephemerocybe angulata TaxID=980116 RepID=A0A8H6I3J2_9AGAR|nr:hypothetical protein DFP72DRAFT_260760 [Tulosesus angulatus]
MNSTTTASTLGAPTDGQMYECTKTVIDFTTRGTPNPEGNILVIGSGTANFMNATAGAKCTTRLHRSPSSQPRSNDVRRGANLTSITMQCARCKRAGLAGSCAMRGQVWALHFSALQARRPCGRTPSHARLGPVRCEVCERRPHHRMPQPVLLLLRHCKCRLCTVIPPWPRLVVHGAL